MADKPETPTGPGGMSLRDWFAGQALAGLLANPEGSDVLGEHVRNANRLADAMMRAREAEGK